MGLFNKSRKNQREEKARLETNVSNHEKDESEIIKRFKSKSADDRLKDIMILGDSGNQSIFANIQYAIENDNDSGVVMAALKRIHKFKGHKDLVPFLERLKSRDNIKNYEPYYSMALLNLEMITEEEFRKIFE